MQLLAQKLFFCVATFAILNQLKAEEVSKPKLSSTLQVSQLDASKFSILTLPPLRIDGKTAKAHTQGLLVHKNGIFVTARRDDIKPRRALLLWLKCNPLNNRSGSKMSWTKIWDITPKPNLENGFNILDHPGGFDFDGKHIWIPISESHRKGKTIIRKFSVHSLINEGKAKHTQSIIIDDHIGAIAISRSLNRIFCANWDTLHSYELSLEGKLIKRFQRNEFISNYKNWSNAVQDWKVHQGFLIASGIDKSLKLPSNHPRSLIQLIDIKSRNIIEELRLPRRTSGNFTREGMAIYDECIWLLPDDLTEENKLYKFPLADLKKNEAQKEKLATGQ